MKVSNPSRFSISYMEVLLGLMALLSILAIFLPRDWLDQKLVIDPEAHSAVLSDDRYSGGSSRVYWLNAAERRWECELAGEDYRDPYCSMLLSLVDDQGNGVDLSEFDRMKLFLNYEGEGNHVRIYLRNRHPNYYVEGDETTTKYNLIEVPVDELAGGLDVALDDFNVADWWLAVKRIPLKLSHPEFNDIVILEIQSGSSSHGGRHTYTLERVVFERALISDEDLYKIIGIAWSVFIFSILLFRVVHLNLELKRHREYQQELVSINNLLNLQNKQFEDLAKTDQLTGLLNRIGIRDPLYNGLKEWKAEKQPFALVMIDIDHFKAVNDNHGHDVGDEILRSAASLFRDNVRHTDYLARWGGEEFILVCPNTDAQQAQTVAELLRKKLEVAEIYDGIKVTASFGVAALSQPNLDLLFKSADEALYEAKHGGRNRVVCRY